MAMVRADVEAGAVLTEAQQKLLDTAQDVMRAMQQGSGAMGPGPGMGAGGMGQGMMRRHGATPPDTSAIH